MGKTLISIDELKYSASENVNFNLNIKKFVLNKSDSILIHGESGSGKSTLLNLLSGTLNPKIGNINILGTDITKISSSQKDMMRGDISLKHKLFYLFAPPGWSHDGSRKMSTDIKREFNAK